MFDMLGDSFVDAASLQKALWWYNTTLGRIIASPPVLSDAVIAIYGAAWVRYVRMAIPLPERPSVPQSVPIGPVAVPTLMVCGAKDEVCKCWDPFGMEGLYEEGGEY